MNHIEKICMLEDELEANLLSDLLTQEGISFWIKSYHDSAMDGLYQFVQGWGHLEAEHQYKEKIMNIYNAMIKTTRKGDCGE